MARSPYESRISGDLRLEKSRAPSWCLFSFFCKEFESVFLSDRGGASGLGWWLRCVGMGVLAEAVAA